MNLRRRLTEIVAGVVVCAELPGLVGLAPGGESLFGALGEGLIEAGVRLGDLADRVGHEVVEVDVVELMLAAFAKAHAVFDGPRPGFFLLERDARPIHVFLEE